MAGFAVNLCQLFEKPEVYFDNTWSRGQLETEFLYQFVKNKEELECRGSDKEVITYIDTSSNDSDNYCIDDF